MLKWSWKEQREPWVKMAYLFRFHQLQGFYVNWPLYTPCASLVVASSRGLRRGVSLGTCQRLCKIEDRLMNSKERLPLETGGFCSELNQSDSCLCLSFNPGKCPTSPNPGPSAFWGGWHGRLVLCPWEWLSEVVWFSRAAEFSCRIQPLQDLILALQSL